MYALLTDQPFSAPGAEQMRFVISDDFGKTWVAFGGGLPSEPSCINDINLDYAVRDALYASTCRGLYRWSGNQWTLVSQLTTYRVAIVYGQPKQIWAITRPEQGPIVKSNDGGIQWQAASQGLIYFSNGIANLAIDPRDANTLYAIISPRYGGSYLRRGTSNGQWITMPTPMNDSQIDIGMTIDGATGDLYVTVFNSRTSRWGVWHSRNPAADINRVQWEWVYEFGDKLWATMLASGWSPQGLALYVRLRDYDSSRSRVVRSLDGGRTWDALLIR